MRPLGILILETAFERIRGDIGCAASFDFPVRYFTVPGATPDTVVHRPDAALLPAFIEGGLALAREGCLGIATTCGFLARWQRELAASLPVPVATSALQLIPAVQATLPQGQRVGVVTYSASSLGSPELAGVGVDVGQVAIAGIDPRSHFAAVIGGKVRLEAPRMAADTVAAAQSLLREHPDIGAIVLECANMPPYAGAVRASTGLPVYDALTLVNAFHHALSAAGAGAPDWRDPAILRESR